MNQYSELLYFLKGLAEDNQLVNTVTKGSVDKIDLEKANIYPLFHIDINDAGFTNGSTITFEVTLTCLNQRDINKEIVEGDKFWSNDNGVDNHNETLAILNDVWLRILRDWEDRDITTEDNATLQKIEFSKGNILDGWILNFTVELPNTTISLCNSSTPVESGGYGYLYNWHAVNDARNIASVDWAVASASDYVELADYLGGLFVAGGELKETGTTHWDPPNTGATNSVGFSLRASGVRIEDGLFGSMGLIGTVWTNTEESSTTATTRQVDNQNIVLGFGAQDKSRGYAVRLVSDAAGLADGVTTTMVGNDGKVYSAIVINELYWITSNYAETKYRNGDWIPGYDGGVYTPIPDIDWSNKTTGALCAYNDDESNV